MKRTQVYLSDSQAARLTRAAARRGVTKSAIVRRAIDHELVESGPSHQEWEEAIHSVAGSWREAPSGAEYVEQLRDGRWLDRVKQMFGE